MKLTAYSKKVVFTLQNKGSYNKTYKEEITYKVVFTFQNKGSYNKQLEANNAMIVVFTFQNKGSYNTITVYKMNKALCLPFKIRAVTTIESDV